MQYARMRGLTGCANLACRYTPGSFGHDDVLQPTAWIGGLWCSSLRTTAGGGLARRGCPPVTTATDSRYFVHTRDPEVKTEIGEQGFFSLPAASPVRISILSFISFYPIARSQVLKHTRPPPGSREGRGTPGAQPHSHLITVRLVDLLDVGTAAAAAGGGAGHAAGLCTRDERNRGRVSVVLASA